MVVGATGPRTLKYLNWEEFMRGIEMISLLRHNLGPISYVFILLLAISPFHSLFL